MDSFIKNFEQQLLNIINNSNLPAGVVYYILKDMANEVYKIYTNNITSSEENDILKKEDEN